MEHTFKVNSKEINPKDKECGDQKMVTKLMAFMIN